MWSLEVIIAMNNEVPTDKEVERKNLETLWNNYYKMCDVSGEDSEQAISMLRSVLNTEETFIKRCMEGWDGGVGKK